MSALYEIVTTDWNGQEIDGNPFKFVGRVATIDGRRVVVAGAPETDEERADLVNKLRKATSDNRLRVTSGGGSDYAHFEVIDEAFNLGKGTTYGPGDYLMVLGDTLALWLPKSVGALFGVNVK